MNLETPEPVFLVLFSFVFGAVVGSFLNVCIYRLPAEKSIVSPPSSCPRCGRRIRWHENIPVVSYLLLKGQCSACHQKISWRYPLVEGLTGALFVVIFLHFGATPATLVYWGLVAALVTITFIDLDHQIIPDVISLPGIAVGFACSFVLPWLTWLDSLVGIVVGGGSLLLVAWGYEKLTGREGMGGGDIKLLAMLGAFLGWQAVLPIIFMSSLAGTMVGVPVMLIQKGDARLAIPFGPFLCFAALVYLLWGEAIVRWYLNFF